MLKLPGQTMVVIFATLCTGVIFIVESTTTLLGSGLNPIGSDVKEYGLYGILVLLLIERWSDIVKGNKAKIEKLEERIEQLAVEVSELKIEKATIQARRRSGNDPVRRRDDRMRARAGVSQTDTW